MSIVNAVTKCTISLGFSIFRSSSLRTSSHTSPAIRLSLLGFQSRSLVTMGVTTAITPAIVGALRCQKDSYLQTLDTEVVSCEEFVPPKSSQPNGKSKTKKSTDPTKGLENGDVAGSKTWLVELADSVLFPEGGGQHTDYGVLTILKDERKEAIPIRNMQRHGLRCIHFSPAPLEPGTPVRQTVDFARRWDLMQQHTGQHLLSAVMDSMDLPTLGWSMGQPGEMNYVELPRKPSEEELQTIQTECNAKIRKSMPITVETPEGKGSDSLPEDYDREKGVVRFIKIGDMDYNACCGTHLQNSSHINIILLHHMQSVRGTNCRLFFTAGDRAIKMATESITGLRSIAVSLSSGSAPADVAAGVQRISDQVSEGRKKVNKLLAEIAAFQGDRIRSHLQGQTTAFMHRGADGLDFINLVLFEIKDFVKEREVVVVLCSGEIKSSGSIVVFGKPDLVEKMAVKVKEVVSTAKGGGKGEKWQGKVTEWQKGEIEALREAVHTQ